MSQSVPNYCSGPTASHRGRSIFVRVPAWRLFIVGAAFVPALTAGCSRAQVEPIPISKQEKDYNRPLPPGQYALRKLTDPSQYPDFSAAYYRAKRPGMRQALEYSIRYMGKPSSQSFYPVQDITHERALASLQRFLQLLDEVDSPQALDEAIRQEFDVYISIGCDDAGTVLFTGYYSPIFNGSLTQTDQFRYPLYRLPQGWKKNEKGDPIGGPWRTRQEIEQDPSLAGGEIVWLSSPFEAYVISVQGSGFIRLPDGKLYEIGYAGHNGHEYTPIGQLMIADGKIEKDKLSLDAMIRYFNDNPDDFEHYAHQNQRYIFFQEAKGGPYGCLGVPVTPYYSVATDKDIFPRASLSFLDTRIPESSNGRRMQTFKSFALDQDRGAAIRAPGRCDIYMGVGDEAGQVAGFTYSEGNLYYIFVKEGMTPVDQFAQGEQTGSGATVNPASYQSEDGAYDPAYDTPPEPGYDNSTGEVYGEE